MDAFTDPDIEEIVFVKPTQVGGTECLNNIVGYIIAQDPSPTLIVYPPTWNWRSTPVRTGSSP
jgi:phage terminase large subunit GpA-like protein